MSKTILIFIQYVLSLEICGSKVIGLEFSDFSMYFYMGIILAIFIFDGNVPVSNDLFIKILIRSHKDGFESS